MRARTTALERNRAGRLTQRLTGPYAAVFAGGCAETALRAWIGELLPGGAQVWVCAIPWATLAVNLADAFLLGLLTGLLARRFPRADLRMCLPLGTDFLGSFTTYGTFVAEAEATTTAQATVYATGLTAYGLLYAWGRLSLGARAGQGNARQGSAGQRGRLTDKSEPRAGA